MPRMHGSVGLQPRRHLSRSCASDVCKPLAITSLSNTFHLFFGFPFLIHQLLSVVPLLNFFLHPFSPLAPVIAICFLRNSSNLSSCYTRLFTYLLQIFSTYHSQYSHFCSLQLPFFFYSQCSTFTTINQNNAHIALI